MEKTACKFFLFKVVGPFWLPLTPFISESTKFDFGAQRRESWRHIFFTYSFQQQWKRHFYVARRGPKCLIFLTITGDKLEFVIYVPVRRNTSGNMFLFMPGVLINQKL